MILMFATILALGVLGLLSVHYLTRLRQLEAFAASRADLSIPPANRYRPMLRLLSENDEALLSSNKNLLRKFRKQRQQIFRSYLMNLSSDYGNILATIRGSMVASGIDRPDLAAALLRNRSLFALAICRIEYRLLLNRMGLGRAVDVSGLVEAISALQTQMQLFNPAYSARGFVGAR